MKKILSSIKKIGLLPTLSKIFTTIKFNFIRNYHETFVFRFKSRKEVFSSIYKNNYWGSGDSISGPGSSLEYTKNIRQHLPVLFNTYNIRSLYDAPCGDYNWLSQVIEEQKINYTGADIVKEIIVSNKNKYGKSTVTFKEMDITEDKFPAADLWLCRDCLFHLSYADIYKALNNFLASDIPYILTTTHKGNDVTNRDIRTGDFRLINLFVQPFVFPKDCLYRFDDYLSPEPEREMCLWTKEQIRLTLDIMKKNLDAQ